MAFTLFLLLLAALLALLPVWRLHVAGWPARWLALAWLAYGVAILFVLRFPLASRFLIPLLIVAFLAPFVAGPERLSRVLAVRRREPGVVIDVTPRPSPSLEDPTTAEPPRSVEGEVLEDPEAGR
jgi:hypothetical protein